MGTIKSGCGISVCCGNHEDTGIFAVAGAFNEALARGLSSISLEARIFAPPDMDKARVYAMKKRMKKAAERLGAEYFSAECLAGAGVCMAQAVVSAAGMREQEAKGKPLPREDIVFTGWAGLEGTLRLIKEKQEELKRRFAPSFLNQTAGLEGEIFACGVIEAIREIEGIKVPLIRQVKEGGILSALYLLAKERGRGFRTDMRAIPLKQETIEICEYFRLDPYRLTSAGSLLVLASDGERLARDLRGRGFAAAVLGGMKEGKDKLMENKGEIRCVNRPSPDELTKILRAVCKN